MPKDSVSSSITVPADVATRVRLIRETLCITSGELITEALDAMLREQEPAAPIVS